ncbi:MAG: hypothetical protein GF384_00880, partial [Elusimicrobia bacterium]|nr:hypothetical protein [Elusimicrobiota bacterium]
MILNKKGFSLVQTVLVFTVVFIVAYGLVMVASKHLIQSTIRDSVDIAQQLADEGVELAIGYLRVDPNVTRLLEHNDPQFQGQRGFGQQLIPKKLDNKGEIILTITTT